MSTTNLSFGDALTALKSGHKVARSGWNGKGMYLVLAVETCDWGDDSVTVFKDIAISSDKYAESPQQAYIPTDPYIVMRTAQSTAQPGWLASQADMLSEDWQIIQGGNS